jgi:hypothetical protein
MPAGLVFIRRLLRQEPLIAMGFRFRRSARLGPLRFNYRFAGLRLQQGWIELHGGAAMGARPELRGIS